VNDRVTAANGVGVLDDVLGEDSNYHPNGMSHPAASTAAAVNAVPIATRRRTTGQDRFRQMRGSPTRAKQFAATGSTQIIGVPVS